jgi:serine/threonine protein kinase
LLQEYLERCKPLDQAAGLPEADARWFFQQLMLGLDFCHRLGIAHQVGLPSLQWGNSIMYHE